MNIGQRLTQIQENLEMLYEQLDGYEKAAILAPLGDKTRIKQIIKREILPQIQSTQRKYLSLLSPQVHNINIVDVEAEEILSELQDAAEIAAINAKLDSQRESMQEILEELKKTDTPATAKLRLAIPLFPGVCSYDFEADTENFFRTIFSAFKKLGNYIPKK